MVPLLVLMLAAAQPPNPALNPRAVELMDSDPVLKQWALRIYDTNHDGWLSLFEAQPAVAAFRDIADSNHDRRVTVREFEAGLAFIRARY